MIEGNCPLCLEPVEKANTRSFCEDAIHPSFCIPCISAYCSHKIENSFIGSCPTMICPCQRDHKDKTYRILEYSEWSSSDVISANYVTKYKNLASSLLLFLCAGCHSLKSLRVDVNTPKEYEHAYQNIIVFMKEQNQIHQRQTQHHNMNHSYTTSTISLSSSNTANKTDDQNGIKINALVNRIDQYCNGEISVDTIHDEIFSIYFPHLSQLPSDREIWEVFKNILALIPEPERQANLHLRYMRYRPRIWTLCCQREHCFKCRTKDYHDGKSCDQNSATLDHSIVDCPGCGLNLCKGDGCNTITCPCGRQFSWTVEKETMERAGLFHTVYPYDTARWCALVLVGEEEKYSNSKSMSNNNVYNNDGNDDNIEWDMTTAYNNSGTGIIYSNINNNNGYYNTNTMSPSNNHNSADRRYSNTPSGIPANSSSNSSSNSRRVMSFFNNNNNNNTPNTNTTRSTTNTTTNNNNNTANANTVHFTPNEVRLRNNNGNNNNSNNHNSNTGTNNNRNSTANRNILLGDAKAWQQRHPVDTSRALLSWWMNNYGCCPSQACAVLTAGSGSSGSHHNNAVPLHDGVREVVDLWCSNHGDEVQQCKDNNAKAIQSLFETFYPHEHQRGVAAVQLLRLRLGYRNAIDATAANDSNSTNAAYIDGNNWSNPTQSYVNATASGGNNTASNTASDGTPSHSTHSSVESLLIASARVWASQHESQYHTAIEQVEQRMADQFLYLYGNTIPSYTALFKAHTPSPTCWNIESSNPLLKFSNHKLTVQRIGNVSSYPAAFADLPPRCDRAQMRVRIDSCPRGPNWLTIGLARRGLMTSASSDGCGRTPHTWGIHDDRSTNIGMARVSANGQDIAMCRKFLQGDVVSVTVDVAEGWLEIAINENEYKYRFIIPVGCAEDYVFAMTFANDHRATMVTDELNEILPPTISSLAVPSLVTPPCSSSASTNSSTSASTPSVAFTRPRQPHAMNGGTVASTSNDTIRNNNVNNSSASNPQCSSSTLLSSSTTTAPPSQSATSPSTSTPAVIIDDLSHDQWYMLLALKRHLRKIDMGNFCVSSERVAKFAKLWEDDWNREPSSSGRSIISHGNNSSSGGVDDSKSGGKSISDGTYQGSNVNNYYYMSATNGNGSRAELIKRCTNKVKENQFLIDCALGKPPPPPLPPQPLLSSSPFSSQEGIITNKYTYAQPLCFNEHQIDEESIGISSSQKQQQEQQQTDQPSQQPLTWNALVYAICWSKLQRDLIEQQMDSDLAMQFLSLHGENAPFLAVAAVMNASHHTTDINGSGSGNSNGNGSGGVVIDEHANMNFHGNSMSSNNNNQSTEAIVNAYINNATSSSTSSAISERRIALAFMKMFPEMMNEWYDYNATSVEPLFGLEVVPPYCRCLPRHTSHCPTPHIV